MSTTAHMSARAVRAWVHCRKVWVELDDGREMGFPIDRHPHLRFASDVDLFKIQIASKGETLHWEGIDEDLPVEYLLVGRTLEA